MIGLYKKLFRSDSTGSVVANELPDTGNRDDRLGGWRNNGTGELFDGFPIAAEDVVVDVGCGDGTNAEFCINRGARVILADSDPARVADSRWRLRAVPSDRFEVLVSDTNPLPIPDSTASKIVSVEVIEHVDDPDQFLKELVRVGRSGAFYLLAVPAPACERLIKHVAPPIAFQKPNHIRVIEDDEFVNMIRNAGLIVERQQSTGFYHALRSLFFWADYVDPATNRAPVLDAWCMTWDHLLDTKEGAKVKALLDSFMPKSQVVIARKP